MKTDGARPDSVGNVEVAPGVSEQEAPEVPTGAFAACKRIVPPLSTIALTFLTVDWHAITNSMGGGHHH